MRIGRHWRAPTALVAGILLVNLVYPCMWFADSTSGVVVDSRTRQPIANAVVSVTWLLDSWEGYPVRWLESRETTTNARGEFEVPGFFMRFQFGDGALASSQPNIRIIARGYLPLRQQGSFGPFRVRYYAGADFDNESFGLQKPGSADATEAMRYFREDFTYVNEVTRESGRRFPLTTRLLDEMSSTPFSPPSNNSAAYAR